MKPEKSPQPRPETLAIIRDSRRRGGWRVVRVRVLMALDLMAAAEVEEVAWPRSHWLPFTRLAKHARRAGRIVRECVEADRHALAVVQAPPVNNPLDGYVREPEPIPAADEKSAVEPQMAGAAAG